jgi:two-component system chemotaxis response regulator CheY
VVEIFLWPMCGDFMKILIADDSTAIFKRLSSILQELQHEVVGYAKTGAQAVKLYEELKPEIVFLDIVMPDMDGLTALRTIRGFDKRILAVILSSAAGIGSNLEKAYQLGARDVITKPISVDAVREALIKCQIKR